MRYARFVTPIFLLGKGSVSYVIKKHPTGCILHPVGCFKHCWFMTPVLTGDASHHQPSCTGLGNINRLNQRSHK